MSYGKSHRIHWRERPYPGCLDDLRDPVDELQEMVMFHGIGVNELTSFKSRRGQAFIHCYYYDPRGLQWLLDHGADIDLPDHVGWTALMEAAFHSDNGSMVNLLEKGANINWYANNNQTVLGVALMYCMYHNPMVLTLLKWGATALPKSVSSQQYQHTQQYQYTIHRISILAMAQPIMLHKRRTFPFSLLPMDILRRLMRYLLDY